MKKCSLILIVVFAFPFSSTFAARRCASAHVDKQAAIPANLARAIRQGLEWRSEANPKNLQSKTVFLLVSKEGLQKILQESAIHPHERIYDEILGLKVFLTRRTFAVPELVEEKARWAGAIAREEHFLAEAGLSKDFKPDDVADLIEHFTGDPAGISRWGSWPQLVRQGAEPAMRALQGYSLPVLSQILSNADRFGGYIVVLKRGSFRGIELEDFQGLYGDPRSSDPVEYRAAALEKPLPLDAIVAVIPVSEVDANWARSWIGEGEPFQPVVVPAQSPAIRQAYQADVREWRKDAEDSPVLKFSVALLDIYVEYAAANAVVPQSQLIAKLQERTNLPGTNLLRYLNQFLSLGVLKISADSHLQLSAEAIPILQRTFPQGH